ncbi:MAG: M3 family oligoendopeptidase [Rhodospirillales bacterium]|nr:M3 family oligoendopeptidase [Rhodospirillales bacterium]MSP79457.1 M3 family oligoendopeptidase [Rhodospirillales bacterium]
MARPHKALPRWSLADLYAGPDDPRLEADVAWVAERSRELERRFQGRVALLAGNELGGAIAAYDAIADRREKILAFVSLRHAADLADPETGRLLQNTTERLTDLARHTLFLTLELNRMEEDALTRAQADPAARRYAPWIREVRAFRDHQLSDELENYELDRSATGGAWPRLFDETVAAMRFRVGPRLLTISATLDLLSNPRRAVRRQAARALAAGLAPRGPLFALVLNTQAKDKEIEDRWRKYPSPLAQRNLANQVEDKVVDALVGAVRESFPRLSHRYYKLKARMLGLKSLEYWDRNAPLPKVPVRAYSWSAAEDIVLGAYRAFSPRMAEIAGRFFRGGWIDAALAPGKDSGAFSHPTAPSVHPYILLNYHGRARDVMTLAHELGHGVHQVLSAPQGALMADAPLTLAETASVFGEMLVFQAMLGAESNPARRRVLLAGKIEDMLNTLVRQVAFHEFERRFHDARRSGEITPERIGAIWLEVQRESLGPAFRFAPEYRWFWAYIPHFVHSPFYVYAYAFGDCLVNALYAVHRGGHPGFEGKYLDMLGAGGTLRHRELLAPFGLDAGEPAFWRRGLDVVAGLIDELEAA